MTTLDHHINVQQLRDLIGTRVRHQGAQWEIIEILEDGPALVLQDVDMHTVIQPDQFGEAHRRVPSTIAIPIFTRERTELNPVLLNLDLIDQAE